MDLWGNEAKTPVPKLDKTKKPETKKQEMTDLQEVYTEGLSERSSQEAWQIWARKIDDEIKAITVRLSEVRELREYVAKNERRLSALIAELSDSHLDKRVAAIEEYQQESNKLLEQINKALEGDN